MAKLKNVGAYPNTEDALGRTDHMNDLFTQRAVVPAQVTAAMDTAKSPLAQKTYIDAQDALYTTKTYVDQQDALLINANTLGASGGVAKLDASSKINVGDLSRTAGCRVYHFTYTPQPSGASSTAKATFSIPAQGFTWWPMWFGWTMGMRTSTTYCYPGVSIRDGTIWIARGWGSARNVNEWYPITLVPSYVTASSFPRSYSGTTSKNFSLYFSCEFDSTGTVSVGYAPGTWFTCVVVPVSTSSSSASWIT